MNGRSRALVVLIPALLLLAHPAFGGGASFDELLRELHPASIGRFGLIFLIAVSTLITEDLTCIAAGLLAAKGEMTPVDAVIAGYIGIFFGDTLIYWLGRLFGVPLLRHVPFRWFLSETAVLKAETHFARRGGMIVFASRFLPGSRSATCFAAGALRQHAGRFIALFAIAAALWTPLLILGTMQIGRGALSLYGAYAKWALPTLIVLALVMYFATRLVLPLFTWRGRRLLLGKWRRFTQWEFWPLLPLTGPVVVYILYLGFIKFRRPTLFTLANPGIPPDSGTIGESKDAIYRALMGAGDAILPWALIPAGPSMQSRLERVEAFMDERGLDFPIVLKCDEGQRSLGVKIIRNTEEARQYLSSLPGDTIAQAYCPGTEYGIFYVRMPEEEHGRIISITEKRLSYVTGNGVDTLERLILADERAVCMAPMFLKRFEERLGSVPADGEKIALVDIGTHAQGALFYDGARLQTPEMLTEIERITKCFKGFFFGRYDLRVPSEEDLKAGRGIRVIELNGVTGQCSHVYSPGNSVFYMWKTIMAQWRIAFEIGRCNLALGHAPMGKMAFIRHWRAAVHRQDIIRNCFGAAKSKPEECVVPAAQVDLADSVESLPTP